MNLELNKNLYVSDINKQLKDLDTSINVHNSTSSSTTEPYSANYVNNYIKSWTLLASGVSQGAGYAKNVPSGAKEIYFEILINNSSTDIIPFILPVSVLTSSDKNYRLGSYFTSGVNYGAVIVINNSRFYFKDAYQNGAYKSGSKMNIYYR